MSMIPNFRDTNERRIWVKAQLALNGTSFAKLARANGCTPKAVSSVLETPSLRMEQIIANAIRVPHQELFSDRYFADGTRKYRVRATQENTEAELDGNVKSDEAA
jgi:lambda repressor-like predicted transcriptional regulator